MSLMASLFVSLLSFSGAITLALGISSRSIALEKTKLFLTALAVGSLLGDAFFHLIPVIFGTHSHGVGGGHGHGHGDSHGHGHEHHGSHEAHGHSHDEVNYGFYIVMGFFICFVVEMYLRLKNDDLESSSEATSEKKQQGHSHSHSHHHHHHHGNSIKPFGWLNLIGDGVHNFIDGISMGATFHQSFKVGMANTMCIIFHEIPQELSDFGVLLSAGFSVKKALLFNFLSGLVCVLGCGLTKALLHYQSALVENKVLLSFTAGSFLYIAAADMVPELWNQIEELQHTNVKKDASSKDTSAVVSRKTVLTLVVSGIMLGLGAMLLIGKLEHMVLDYLS